MLEQQLNETRIRKSIEIEEVRNRHYDLVRFGACTVRQSLYPVSLCLAGGQQGSGCVRGEAGFFSQGAEGHLRKSNG
jgi:hypothetical protein